MQIFCQKTYEGVFRGFVQGKPSYAHIQVQKTVIIY